MRIAFDDLRHKRWRDVPFDAMREGARSPLVFEPRVEATQERSAVRKRVLRALADVIEQNALYKLSHDAWKSVKVHLEALGIGEADVLWVFE
jgi:hypothetical protein